MKYSHIKLALQFAFILAAGLVILIVGAGSLPQ